MPSPTSSSLRLWSPTSCSTFSWPSSSPTSKSPITPRRRIYASSLRTITLTRLGVSSTTRLPVLSLPAVSMNSWSSLALPWDTPKVPSLLSKNVVSSNRLWMYRSSKTKIPSNAIECLSIHSMKPCAKKLYSLHFMKTSINYFFKTWKQLIKKKLRVLSKNLQLVLLQMYKKKNLKTNRFKILKKLTKNTWTK